MSWEDNKCPCGGHKERQTMLCSACETFLADHPSMAAYKDEQRSLDARRHAAIVLCTLARKRLKTPTR